MLLLTDVQKARLSIAPKSAAGNPAPVDNTTVKWDVSDPEVLTIEPVPGFEDDPLQKYIVTTGKLGSSQVSVTADADLGDGIETISGVLDVEVKVSQAVSVGIEAGAPEERL